MATANFILRGSTNDKPHSITLIFRYSNKVLKYPSGFKTFPDHWNTNKQELKNKVEVINRDMVNAALLELKSDVLNAYNELIKEKAKIDNNALRERLNGSNNSNPTSTYSKYVSEFTSKFLESAPKRLIQKSNGETTPLNNSTIKQYKNTLSKLKTYEQEINNSKLKFTDLNLNFHESFIGFLQSKYNLSNSTISSRIKDLKRLANYAQQKGIEVNPQIFTREFFRPTDESVYIYLNEVEIQQLFEFDFSHNERLENARDLLIMACHTGQRVSDLMRISTDKIDFKKGLIYLRQIKTKTKVVIPLHWQVEEIIQKRNGELPRSISDQKFNDYIKEVCKVVGLNEPTRGTKKVMTSKGMRKTTGVFPKYELILSHSGRRSFASNNYGKLPNINIMAITGHKSEKTFLNYIKVTPEEHAEKMLKVWEKERLEYLEMKNRKTQLKAI